MRVFDKSAFVLTASLFALMAPQAYAQDAADSEDSANEIVVTAQRREENIQDVPLSIAAVSGDRIEELAITTPAQLFSQIPNVKFQMPTGSSGFPIFNIRGVTLLDFSDSNEASVAVYADDVYFGSPAVQNQQFFDVQRVEVLRGPQGTLYGRNATGGLVNVLARRPTDDFEGSLTARYGSDNEYALEGVVSGPFSDSARGRLAIRTGGRDGWQTNVFNGHELGGIDTSFAARGLVEIDATESLSLVGNIHYSLFEGSEDGRAFFGARVPGSTPSVRCTTDQILSSACVNSQNFSDPDPDPTHVYSEEDDLPARVENVGGWLRADWNLGFADLTSITSYDIAEKLDTLDADQSPSPAGRLTLVYNTDHEQWSQEFRLAGDTERLNWILGAYYYADTRFFTATLTRLAGSGSWADQTVATQAIFGQTTWAATPTFNLTLGARYTWDQRELEGLAKISSGGLPGTHDGIQQYLITRSLDSERLTWRAAADWHFLPDHMLYASASTGFKSGAFNTLLPAADPNTVQPADPEFITSYEIGLKGDMWNGRLRYDIAAFYSDYESVQAQGTLANPTPISTLNTIGDATIQGLEASLTAEPIDGLTATFGVGFLETEIHAAPGTSFNGVNLNGHELVMAPSVSFNGSLRYEREVGEIGSLYGMTDFQWQDSVFFGPDNLPTEAQEAYGLINFHIGWISPTRDIELSAFVRNAADEEYFIHGVDSGGATQVGYQWGRPRTWGVQLRHDF